MWRENNQRKKGRGAFVRLLVVPILLLGAVFSSVSVYAQQELSQADVDEIEEEIESRQIDIQRLEEEIRQYERQVSELSAEKQTLANEVERLEVSQRKLEADISLAQNKIDLARSEISKLDEDIAETEAQIEQGRNAVTRTIRQVYKQDSDSLVEALLAHDTLSDFWGEMDTMLAFQSSVTAGVQELNELEAELSAQRQEQEELRQSQVALRGELEDKADLVIVNKQEQAELLSETANKEEEYQRLLEERVARKEAFEQELRELESQLQIAIDPGAIPSAGSGVLSWPVDNVAITQYFGNTAFATDNPQVYSGNGHNGVDFGIATGTRIKSAANGVVKGVGNTDLSCPNASYGKWVLVEHDNGLSTLYAHLSQANVTQGQSVSRGETIAYSGNTGYSTGPHLHFTVYASQGVQISNLPSRACGTMYTLPLADPDAYLNPLSFL